NRCGHSSRPRTSWKERCTLATKSASGNEILTVIEAREIILSAVRTRPAQAVSLIEALDCVLAQEIASPINLPLWDNSAVDGYAVRSSDVADANEDSPIHLRVTVTVPAGTAASARLDPQTCARIFTGAPIPEGADAVVMQEDTR